MTKCQNCAKLTERYLLALSEKDKRIRDLERKIAEFIHGENCGEKYPPEGDR